MDAKDFIELAKQIVVEYTNKQGNAKTAITSEDTYVVWQCKTLQNNKALLSTNVPDLMYFEVTYNGDKKEIYFDAYKKIQNERYVLGEYKPINVK